MVNTLIPPALFATIGAYSPKALAAIINALGPNLPKFFPTINLGVSGLITGAEVGLRKRYNHLHKSDDKIHLPPFIPYGPSLSRQQASLLIVIGWALQTAQGVLAQYTSEEHFEKEVLAPTFSDAGLALFSQTLLAFGADRLINTFSQEDGYGNRGVRAIGGFFSGCTTRVGTSNSSDPLNQTLIHERADSPLAHQPQSHA